MSLVRTQTFTPQREREGDKKEGSSHDSLLGGDDHGMRSVSLLRHVLRPEPPNQLVRGVWDSNCFLKYFFYLKIY
jgi:hypothetical protein